MKPRRPQFPVARPQNRGRPPVPGTGLARALSKLGFCSRREGWTLVQAGRVRLNGAVCRDPEQRVWPGRDRIEVDGAVVEANERVYVALNKPRGLVTTTADERGRETVLACLAAAPDGRALPRLVPVGRLDQASEGLLLLTNDNAWAAAITDPQSHLDKVYHVQVDGVMTEAMLGRLREGVEVEGERWRMKRVEPLRAGEKTSWLAITLDEGRNRQIRRMLEALGVEVLRLVRVSVGPVALGELGKGCWRRLRVEEVRALALGAQRRPTGIS